MILGVFLVLLGESLLLCSIPLFGWFAAFVVANALYIPIVEEKALERRFGLTYSQYQKGVPRWFPRWTAWHPANDTTSRYGSDSMKDRTSKKTQQ